MSNRTNIEMFQFNQESFHGKYKGSLNYDFEIRIRFDLKTVDTCGVSNTCTLLFYLPCQYLLNDCNFLTNVYSTLSDGFLRDIRVKTMQF